MVKKWTEGRLKSFIISVIRSGMLRYPPKYEALKSAKVGKKINKASGRLAEHYKCAQCKEDFPQKEVQVDHKKPVVDPKVGFVNWNIYINRMFCELKNFQILCKTCHKEKTKKRKD